METVEEILNKRKFDTDKYSHQYFDFYKPIFEKYRQSENIMEIGVFEGKSIELLSQIFYKSNIIGIDIHDKKYLNLEKNSRIQTFIADQSSREELGKILNDLNVKFDFILDDGGHTMRQQQVSLGFLFPYLKNGGVYILEDLHTSRMPERGFIEYDDEITSLDMLENKIKEGKIYSNHMTSDEIDYLNNNIKNIEIWSINEEKNQSVTSSIYKK